MLKKIVKYTDFDGKPQEREYLFNYNKMEIVRLQKSVGGDFDAYLSEVQKSGDVNAIMTFITKFIVRALGHRSEDGQSFEKSHKEQKAFENSAAFEQILDDLLEHPESMEGFVKATANLK